MPWDFDATVAAYRTMETLLADGRAHAAAGISTQAWSPIGGVLTWNADASGRSVPLADP